jgi:hypothetical protein
MGGKNTIAIVVMGLGVIGIYLGASGHLESFWTGLTGGYDSGGSDSSGDIETGGASEGGDGAGGSTKIMPNAGGFGGPSGTGGVFYALPTGGMASSASGLF